jgi:hypothetical protein
MANIYDSEIRCADKKALNKLTKLILKYTPSKVLEKSGDTVVFETRWDDLDYAMEVFSQEFPELTFSCSFIHMTTCYEYYKTFKDYRNGIVIYKGLQPIFSYSGAELEKIKLEDYGDFVSRYTAFFSTMYEEKKLEDGTYYLEYIPDRYRSKNENFYPQAVAEYDDCILTATLHGYSHIRLELTLKNHDESHMSGKSKKN